MALAETSLGGTQPGSGVGASSSPAAVTEPPPCPPPPPGTLSWVLHYILTTNKSDHETRAGLGWKGRHLYQGGVTVLGFKFWVQIPLLGCVTVDRSHGFCKPATILLSTVKAGVGICDHKVPVFTIWSGTPIHPFHSQTGHLRLRGLVHATQPGLLCRPALGPAIVLIPIIC